MDGAARNVSSPKRLMGRLSECIHGVMASIEATPATEHHRTAQNSIEGQAPSFC